MAQIVSIVYRPRGAEPPRPEGHFTRESLERARLVESQGIEGDAKGGSGDRHLNVMLAELLADLGSEGFKVGPGELGEQIIISGLDPETLVPGARLKLGSAVIEVGILRTGCARFEAIQGKSKQLAKGRLGVMACVVSGGEIAIGDAVELLSSDVLTGT